MEGSEGEEPEQRGGEANELNEMREATRERLMQLHILLSRLTLHRLCLVFITFVVQFIRVFL